MYVCMYVFKNKNFKLKWVVDHPIKKLLKKKKKLEHPK